MNISCAYCNRPLTRGREVVTVCSDNRMYLFCSIGCRDLYGFRKLTNRICGKEGCKNRIPDGNRMLCSNCHKRGNHSAETELFFDEADRAHWERMERELHRRIEEGIKIYSSQDMSQEELRALVPSIQEEAA